VDKRGRVNIEATTQLSFSTELDHLPLELLQAIAEVLEKKGYNQIRKNIEKRTKRSIHMK
jgi:hypothetical protein